MTIKDDKNTKIILARILELAGNINNALSTYKELHSEDEKDPFYLLKIGILEERLGNINEAEKYYRRIVKSAKGKVKAQAIYSLGYLLIRKNKLDEAAGLISYFKKEEKELPLHLKYIEGRILCGQGEFNKALEIVEEELKKELTPEMSRHFFTLGGLIKLQSENCLEALKYFQECIDIAKEEKDIMHEGTFKDYKAICFLKLDKYKESIEEFEEAILLMKKLKIGNEEYHCLGNLCDVYLRIGYWEKLKCRIEDFKKRYGKIHPFLMEKLLYSKLYKGEWNGIEEIYHKLEKEDYDLSYYFSDTGGILFTFKKEWKKAEKVFKIFDKKIVGYPEKKRTNSCGHSEVLYEQGKTKEAIDTLKPYKEQINSIQSDFEKGKVLATWGLINSDVKSIDKAIGYFSKIGLPFYTAQAQLKKARVLIKENKIDEAIDELKKAEEVFRKLKAGFFIEKTNEL
ncbi:MAG: tetratricopeptide repeat protein, partial [candidate division WOR-3 bacterium]